MVQVPRIAPSTAIEHYDPYDPPDPKAWLALDEFERMDLVEDYHREAGIRLPNETIHATIHVTVENQIALGDELPVKRTLQRLMAEGLDRHDALHAIGAELAMHMNELLRKGEPDADPNRAYFDALARLTADRWRRSADDPGEEPIEAERILNALGAPGPFPVEAIRAARANRDSMVPVFANVIERYLAGETRPSEEEALFLIFHLLGEWREKSTYRLLAELLRRPTDDVEHILGDTNTNTSHRVMAAVFDGDPQPIYDLIMDPETDEWVRSRMCETIAMLTIRGELSRDEAARFLRESYPSLRPQGECMVWDGWQSAISMIGLVELKPLVEQAFKQGYISPTLQRFEDFEQDLQRTVEGSGPWSSWRAEDEFTLFGDVIEELSDWSRPDPDEDIFGKQDVDASAPPPWNVPAVNPFKGVGRNDPCPCGSGKKFKKCCLK